MHEAISAMLEKYQCTTSNDYRNALKEILQELTLFGLWRSKFFEHAAFYGGTALRILYKLNRFSEDLDFSLLKPDPSFSLDSFEQNIRRELSAFGFTLSVEVKEKNLETAVQSAFIKGNTLEHLLTIGIPKDMVKQIHAHEVIKIKFEVDTDPPPRFTTTAVPVYLPAPFSVRTYTLSDMFAGKLSALLFRQWKNRVKGRDWFDFLWFIGKDVEVNLDHLIARLHQTDPINFNETLTLDSLKLMLDKKIDSVDLSLVKKDVEPFIRNPSFLEGYSKELFHDAVRRLKAT